MITKNYDYWQDSYDFQPADSVEEQIDGTKMIFTGFNMISKMIGDTFKGIPYNISSVIPADDGLSARVSKKALIIVGRLP
jgi:hypothetical protein